MDMAPELTIEEIDEIVAKRIRGVQKSRVVGEYLPAGQLGHGEGSAEDRRRSSADDRRTIWLGRFLQFSKGSGLLRESRLITTRGQFRLMDDWCRKKWGKSLHQLEGHEVAFEIEPGLGYGGRLELRALRVLDVEEEGCWTRAKADERSRLGGRIRTGGSAEKRLALDALPSKITVIAPRRGSASRSDIHRILSSSKALADIPVEWATEIGFTGRHAPSVIAQAVREAGTEGGLVLLMRGGGSPADFWPFETAEVAEAIRRCSSRVITALGHEEDHSLADDVAAFSFAVPRSAADAIVSACGEVLAQHRGGPRRGRPRYRGASPQRQRPETDLQLRLRSVEADLKGAIARCRLLQADLDVAQVAERKVAADRDRAQAELGLRILQSLEFEAGGIAIKDMRDAIHLRYLSVLPAALALFFGWACVVGVEGSHRVVWGTCAVLFLGALVAVLATARHLARRARSAVSERT